MPDSFFDRPRTMFTLEDMNARLDARVAAARGRKVEGGGGDRLVPPADLPANAAPTPTALDWLPAVRRQPYIESTCGRYTVTAAKVQEVWRYSAWRREPRTLLGCEDELSVAKLLCVDNARL